MFLTPGKWSHHIGGVNKTIDHIVEARGMVFDRILQGIRLGLARLGVAGPGKDKPKPIGGKMKITIDQQIQLLIEIIRTGEKSNNWRSMLQVAMFALDSTEATGLHQNIPVIDGGPDEIN